jgi:hypothetical protein
MPPRASRSKWAGGADSVDAIIQNLRTNDDEDSNSSGDEDMSGDDYRGEAGATNGAATGDGEEPTGRGSDDAVFKCVSDS